MLLIRGLVDCKRRTRFRQTRNRRTRNRRIYEIGEMLRHHIEGSYEYQSIDPQVVRPHLSEID